MAKYISDPIKQQNRANKKAMLMRLLEQGKSNAQIHAMTGINYRSISYAREKAQREAANA